MIGEPPEWAFRASPRVVGLIDVAADVKTLAASPSRRRSRRLVMLERGQGLALGLRS
jgi:hypothetical protein